MFAKINVNFFRQNGDTVSNIYIFIFLHQNVMFSALEYNVFKQKFDIGLMLDNLPILYRTIFTNKSIFAKFNAREISRFG